MFSKKSRKIASIIALIIVLLFILGMIASPILSTRADSLSDLQSQYSSLEKQSQQIQQQINDSNTTLSSVTQKKLAIDKNLDLVNQQISILNTQISTLNSRIDQKNQEITDKQKNIDDNNALLKERLCALYEEGNVSYIAVLLSSDNLTQFLNRVELLKTITEHDTTLINQMKGDKVIIETDKKSVESSLAAVEASKQELTKKQKDYSSQKNEQAKQLKAVSDQLNALNAKAEQTEENMQAASDAVTAYIKAHQSVSIVFDGGFQWPIHGAGYISCGYGGYSGHTGVDNAATPGTPIYAAASGRVILTKVWDTSVGRKDGSYGTYLVIDHGVYNGSSYQTLYGHCSKLLVSEGGWVTQGQEIALVGNTGNVLSDGKAPAISDTVSGAHLHFEIRVNGTPVNPYNFVTPY